MKVGPGLLIVAALATAGLPQAAGAQGVAVHGLDRALILPPSGAVVSEYRNAGYEMHFRSGGVEIVSRAAAGESSTQFVLPPEAPADDDMARLARRLTAGARTRQRAVSRVLGWMSSSIRYSLERDLSQDPDAVLARRSGYCTGVARLAVALLTAVGIPAREVPGYVLADGVGGPGAKRRGYHRWIEVFDPALGWRFSDPLITHHWVPATYLRLDSEQVVGYEAQDDAVLMRHSREIVSTSPISGVGPGVQVGRRTAPAAMPVMVSSRHRGGLLREAPQTGSANQQGELSK